MRKNRFPLYLNDGKCIEKETQLRRENIELFKKAVNNKELKYVNNKCLCGNDNLENDIIISEKDRYGFAIPQILCSKCGLVRSGIVLDEDSNRLFYEKYYRGIYLASSNLDDVGSQIEQLYIVEYKKGKEIVSLLKNYNIITNLSQIADIGCGAGGVLMPFKEIGVDVNGFDYDYDYLDFGREKGLDLILGDFYELAEDNSYDLIILNHVLEHFLNPIEQMQKLLSKCKVGGYMYIEVPGLFNIKQAYPNPLRYFQNAHVYYFYKEYLNAFFKTLGMEVIYSDEICRFIVEKTEEKAIDAKVVYFDSLSKYPDRILDYLFHAKRKFLLNPVRYISYLGKKIKHFCG